MGLSFPIRTGMASKLALATALGVLADWLFYRHPAGSTVGLFAVSLIAAVAFVGDSSTRATSLGALVLASLFALVLVDAPNALRLTRDRIGLDRLPTLG